MLMYHVDRRSRSRHSSRMLGLVFCDHDHKELASSDVDTVCKGAEMPPKRICKPALRGSSAQRNNKTIGKGS